jgi:hypothetical protein
MIFKKNLIELSHRVRTLLEMQMKSPTDPMCGKEPRADQCRADACRHSDRSLTDRQTDRHRQIGMQARQTEPSQKGNLGMTRQKGQEGMSSRL